VRWQGECGLRKKTFEVAGEGVCEGPRACDEIVVTVC